MGRRTGLGQCVDGTFRPAAQVPALKWAPRATCLAELVPAMVLVPPHPPSAPAAWDLLATEGCLSQGPWRKALGLLTEQVSSLSYERGDAQQGD